LDSPSKRKVETLAGKGTVRERAAPGKHKPSHLSHRNRLTASAGAEHPAEIYKDRIRRLEAARGTRKPISDARRLSKRLLSPENLEWLLLYQVLLGLALSHPEASDEEWWKVEHAGSPRDLEDAAHLRGILGSRRQRKRR
jgi:hypothetical protein